MRLHGKTSLGFSPLPLREAQRLKNCLTSASAFSALDPCVGDGAAFTGLLHGVSGYRYGIEIDANRAEQARALGIETLAEPSTRAKWRALRSARSTTLKSV